MSHTGSRAAAELRAKVRQRDGDHCSECAKPIDFTKPPGTLMGPSLEHVIPRAAGGSNDLANLRLSHAFPCNHAKGAKHDGTDFSAQPTRRHARPDVHPVRQRNTLTEFESWSAMRQ